MAKSRKLKKQNKIKKTLKIHQKSIKNVESELKIDNSNQQNTETKRKLNFSPSNVLKNLKHKFSVLFE